MNRMSGLPSTLKNRGKYLLLCLYSQRLRFCFWPKFCRNSTDETGIESKLSKDRTDLTERNCWLVQLEMNQVMIAIDFVAKPRNGGKLLVQVQNFVQVVKAVGVNFQFEHSAKLTNPARRMQCS